MRTSLTRQLGRYALISSCLAVSSNIIQWSSHLPRHALPALKRCSKNLATWFSQLLFNVTDEYSLFFSSLLFVRHLWSRFPENSLGSCLIYLLFPHPPAEYCASSLEKWMRIDGCRWRPGTDSFWCPWLLPADTLLDTSVSPQGNTHRR